MYEVNFNWRIKICASALQFVQTQDYLLAANFVEVLHHQAFSSDIKWHLIC